MEVGRLAGVRQSDGFAPQRRGAFLVERRGELGRAAMDGQKVFVLQAEALVLSHSAQSAQVRQLRVALLPGQPVAPVLLRELPGERALQVLVRRLQEQRRAAQSAERRLELQAALPRVAAL